MAEHCRSYECSMRAHELEAASKQYMDAENELDRLREQIRRARELLIGVQQTKTAAVADWVVWRRIDAFLRETDPAEPKEVSRG